MLYSVRLYVAGPSAGPTGFCEGLTQGVEGDQAARMIAGWLRRETDRIFTAGMNATASYPSSEIYAIAVQREP